MRQSFWASIRRRRIREGIYTYYLTIPSERVSFIELETGDKLEGKQVRVELEV